MISFWMLSEFVILRRFSGVMKNKTALGAMTTSISSVVVEFGVFFYFYITTAAV